jgi:hypothetical protein
VKDLLGREITIEEAAEIERIGKKKRKQTKPNGYFKPPGSAMTAETCGSCRHSWRSCGGNKNFWKCDLVKPTRGAGTDIRLKSPACSEWKAKEVAMTESDGIYPNDI